MNEPLAYRNGRLVPQSEVNVPFYDAGFVFGATVTDFCRTFRLKLFRLSDHLARFRQGCDLARIPQPVPDQHIAAAAEELVDHNGGLLRSGQDLALVMFATPGPIGYYAGQPGGPGDGAPTLCLHTFPLPLHRYTRLFREGARLVTPDVRHLPAACVDPRIKHRSRLIWWLAEQQAHAVDGFASALLLDLNGHVTETAAANLLAVRNGTVLSPPRTSALDGISLRVVEELCREMRVPWDERPLTLDDCLGCEEVLLTNTSYCVVGVSRINGVPIPWPGPVWQRLLLAWSDRVGVDIRGQILAATDDP